MINKNIQLAAKEVYKEEGLEATITFLKKREADDNEIANFLQEHCEQTGCPTKELNGEVIDTKCPNCEDGSVLDFCSNCDYETAMRKEVNEVSGTTMGDLFNLGQMNVMEKKFEKPPKKPNFIKRLFGLK